MTLRLERLAFCSGSRRMSCRWVFLEEVKIVRASSMGLLLISVDRIHGFFGRSAIAFWAASILSSSLIGSNSTTAS